MARASWCKYCDWLYCSLGPSTSDFVSRTSRRARNSCNCWQSNSSKSAQSLEFRFACEKLLIVKAIERPVFGWGGWSRSDVYFDEGEADANQKVPTDGLWIVALGTKAFVGLAVLGTGTAGDSFSVAIPANDFAHSEHRPCTARRNAY
jgi:hypothetical protein